MSFALSLSFPIIIKMVQKKDRPQLSVFFIPETHLLSDDTQVFFFFLPSLASNSLYAEDNLELLIPLPSPPKYWDCKSAPLWPAYPVPFEMLL